MYNYVSNIKVKEFHPTIEVDGNKLISVGITDCNQNDIRLIFTIEQLLELQKIIDLCQEDKEHN